MLSDQQPDRLRLAIDPDQRLEPSAPHSDPRGGRGAKRIVGDLESNLRTHHFGGVGPAVELTDIADQDDTDHGLEDDADVPATARSRWWPIAMATLASLGFAGIIWYAYTSGVGTLPPEELPVVQADAGPVKARPENPGGLEVPYQENLALNEVEPDPASPQVERLLPPPETPMPPPAVQSVVPSDAAPANVPPAPTGPPAPAVTVAEVPIKAPAPVSTQSAAIPSGEFVLQLASLKAKERAPAEWARLQETFPSLLGNRELVVLSVDLGSRGVFYRLQAGYFSDRNSADAACAQIKAKRQDCLVTKR